MSSVEPKLAGVRFHAGSKVYHFDAAHLPDLKEGDFVIVETTRGRQIGQVVALGRLPHDALLEAVKPVERKATGRDLALRRYWQSKEAEALTLCRKIAAQLELPLKIVSAEYSFDGARLLFAYMAEDKVETQALRQEVSKSFRARVEFKLIGARDVAKLLGGYGACGELQCCTRFLTDFSSISIKMAKEQDISLNPQEITGMCGRLRCCLAYEYEHYAETRRSLPKRGKEIGTPHGRGVVVDVLPLREAVLVRIGEQQFEVHRDDVISLEEYEKLVEHAARPVLPPAEPTSLSPAEEPKEAPAVRRRRPRSSRRAARTPAPSAAEEKPQAGERAPSRRRRRKRRPADQDASNG